jgi:ribosomal protein L11 methylase PrmA
LSGIMETEAFQIEDKLAEEKFTILEKIQKDEWVAYSAKI